MFLYINDEKKMETTTDNENVHKIITNRNAYILSEIKTIFDKIQNYISEQLKVAPTDFNPQTMLMQLHELLNEIVININTKIKTLTNKTNENILLDINPNSIYNITSIHSNTTSLDNNILFDNQMKPIHNYFSYILDKFYAIQNNFIDIRYKFYIESLIISSYALEQFKALDTSLQNLNSVTYVDKIELKTFFSNYKNTISPQQQPVITPPSNTPINPLSGGTNKSEKILYKGHWYVIRQQGRKKYIKTKDTLIPLVDVKKWQKASKKIKK